MRQEKQGSGGWVQVVKAGESDATRNKSRVCHAVLKARKAGCSKEGRLPL